jgi:stress responsive alpha/beta barrel protein
MILHVVLFRFKPGVAADRIARAGEAFLAMRGAIPDIRRISWGANLGPSAGEYSHVLVVTLDDMVGVERYLQHPVHRQTVADFVADIREARLAVDVET